MTVKKIQETLVKSGMTLGDARKLLDNAISLALTELSEQKVVDILQKAERSLHAEINTKKWRQDISAPLKFPEMTAKYLLDCFNHNYPKLFGTVYEHDYFIENAKKVAAILSRDVEACAKLGVDLNKGVLLYGGVGVGKTSIMKCYSYILKTIGNEDYPPFRTLATIDVSNDFKKNGAVAINRYTNKVNEGLLKNAGLFFDDLGNETEASNFGNQSNVMEEIIQIIYNKPQMKGFVHFSTNLSKEDICNKYGERVYSRITELCNIIKFPANAKDMRL